MNEIIHKYKKRLTLELVLTFVAFAYGFVVSFVAPSVRGIDMLGFFAIFLLISFYKRHSHKHSFILALTFIISALLIFLYSHGNSLADTINKLSEWAYLYLLSGAILLLRNKDND